MGFYKKWKEKHAFNAENCRKKQQKFFDENFIRKMEDIRGRIDYVVSNSIEEHAVIYCVNPLDRELYVRISDYFYNLGFFTIITNIEALQDDSLIIRW